MTQIPTYDPAIIYDDEGHPCIDMPTDKSGVGEYVTRKDHDRVVADLEDELDTLRTNLEHMTQALYLLVRKAA